MGVLRRTPAMNLWSHSGVGGTHLEARKLAIAFSISLCVVIAAMVEFRFVVFGILSSLLSWSLYTAIQSSQHGSSSTPFTPTRYSLYYLSILISCCSANSVAFGMETGSRSQLVIWLQENVILSQRRRNMVNIQVERWPWLCSHTNWM